MVEVTGSKITEDKIARHDEMLSDLLIRKRKYAMLKLEFKEH